MREIFDREARLSWVLAVLAGLLGATAFTHTAGYFVTFMTGNARRAVLGLFQDHCWLSISGALILTAFIGGAVFASLCRRRIWAAHPHSPIALTTLSLAAATTIDAVTHTPLMDLLPILFVAFGIGALNTSFVQNGEVSIPLSYVTGTLVKLGQGIEQHLSGGTAADWLGHFLLFASYVAGATLGGGLSLVTTGAEMLAAATVMCAVTTGYTFHAHRIADSRRCNSRRNARRLLDGRVLSPQRAGRSERPYAEAGSK